MSRSTAEAPVSDETLRSRFAALRSDRITRSTAFLVLAQGSVAVVGFVFWLASARLANVDEVGEATTLVAASSLIAYLGLFGINTTFMRFLPTSADGDRELSSGLLACFLGTALISLGYVELLPVITPKLAFVQASPLDTAGFVVFTAFGAVNVLTDSVFLARQQTKYILIADGAVQGLVKVLAPLALIALGVYGGYRAFGIFTSFGSASAADVIASVVFIVVRLGYRPELRIRVRALTHALRYTATNYAVSVLDILPTLILPTIVLDGAGTVSAGYFYIAFQVASVLSGVGISIAVSALAEGAQDGVRLEEVVARSRRLLLVALPPLVVVGALMAPWILVIFGSSYRAHGSETLLVLVLAAPAVALCQWTRALLQITKQLRALLVSQSLYAVIVLGASIALVGRGIGWVAAAYLVGNVIAGLVAGASFLLHQRSTRRRTTAPPAATGAPVQGVRG
jgi:O-antigen/teichoic acid export membrane protein